MNMPKPKQDKPFDIPKLLAAARRVAGVCAGHGR
jgi:hypothetical protein